jgi:cobalt/nickel transport protein
VSLFLAGVVSNVASTSPDGLDAASRAGCTVDAGGKITGGDCAARRESGHELARGPLANYGVKGVANPYLATGLAGVIGVLVVFAVGGGLFWLVRRRPERAATAGPGMAEPGTVEGATRTGGD